jgi:methionine synthase I (cobalamin-dependent)
MDKTDILKLKINLNRPLILDGAMGTWFQQMGFAADKNLWYSYLNVTHPQTVLELHRLYIEAGADIITTNTFRTNPNCKKKSNLSLTNAELVKRSVTLAKQAQMNNNKIIVAGANAPAEDCYQKERTISKFDLEYNHKKHIELLYEAGCDIIWNETHSHLDEIEIISKFCSESSIPFVMNLYFDESLRILSGEPLPHVVTLLNDYSPQVIGFNCVKPNVLNKYTLDYDLPQKFGFYLNCGKSDVNLQNMQGVLTPKEYLNAAEFLFPCDPVYVGSCCGSTPAHTKVLKEYFDEINRN